MDPKETTARRIVETLHRAGFDAYFAGGCVRDRLRGEAPKDYDIATAATPADIAKLFPKTVPVGVQFGVMLVIEEGTPFEVATFRTEGGYQDGRRPSEVAFASVEEDARRRDFTVNGLYFDLRKNEVLDFVGGREDLGKKIIRTIGDPEKRFLEDHLRMLRAVRFAVQLGFTIEAETLRTLKKHAGLIEKVSQERIRDELTKILTSADPARGVRLMDEVGLLQKILPEMETMKGVEQPSEYHPEGDVFIHTLMLVDGLSYAPIELAMGCLLHDVAKPKTFVRAPDRIRFHGHDKLGAEMSREILKRLTFAGAQIDIICSLVAEHLKFKDVFNMKISTLKRFFALERFDLHMELHRLDCLASHGKLDAYEFCKTKLAEFGAQPPPPTKLVTGADLIKMGFQPGPRFAEMLRAMEDAVLEGQIRTREEAVAFIESHYGKGK
jgi:poly(A) polymerase